MILTITNISGSTKTYLSGAISITSASTITITNPVQQLALATDGTLRSDLNTNNVTLGDGTNTFGSIDALAYLYLIPQVLNPTSDGLGNLITSTIVGSKQAIDTNVVNITTSSDKTGSGTIVALNGTIVATTNGCSTVNFIVTGTWNALLLIEGSIDGGTTWSFLNGDADATDTITTSISTNTLLTVPCGGLQFVRLRALTYTSGTVNITWNAGVGTSLLETFTTDRNGSGTVAALNAAVVMNTQSAATVQANITGTWNATIVIEGFLNNNWVTISGDIDSVDTVATSFTSNGLVTINCGGFAQIRFRASIYTSGTATVDWNSSQGVTIVEVFNGNGNVLNISSKSPLIGASPASVTVGVASLQIVAANASRRGLVITNISKNIVYFNANGGTAVVNSGITLYPGGVWEMDEYSYTVTAVTGIASAASSIVAVQEFT